MPHLLDVLTTVPQSAERLADQLGVTTEAVGAELARLMGEGVPLLTTPGGHALALGTPAPTSLRPRGAFGRAYRYLGTLESTQDELRAWRDAPHGAVVLAERQRAGRGRRGRPWHSPGEALTFSLLLSEGPVLDDPTLAPFAAGVALRAACGVGGLKWPNDLLAPDGRKLAGVLLESELRGGRVRRALLGVGLNVRGAPPGGAALGEFRPVQRAELLSELLWQLEGWLAAPRGQVLATWREGSVTLGREVRVQTAQGEVCGVARALEWDGALSVETARGTVRVTAGDVTLVGTLVGSRIGSRQESEES